MWTISASKGLFLKEPSRRTPPSGSIVTDILGAPSQNCPQGNYVELDKLMQSFDVIQRSNSSDQVYCGMTTKVGEALNPRKGDLVDSYRHKDNNAAWIKFDLRYLEMAAGATKSTLLFPQLVDAAIHHEYGQRMLDNARTVLFEHTGSDYDGEHRDYPDDSDLLELVRVHPDRVKSARAAVFFVLAHELDHLFRGDLGRTPKPDVRDRLRRANSILGSNWPTLRKHQDEALADHTAVEFVGEAALRAGFQLKTVMIGSFISMTAVALDGWFMDQSAASDSHPSPFARAHGLFDSWIAFLERQNTYGWQKVQKPSRADLLDVTNSFVHFEWNRGLYGNRRAKIFGLIEDRKARHERLCRAAGA